MPLVVPKPKGELPEAFASSVFGLVNPLIQHAVADEKYHTPTPIQEQSIPPLLEGRDLLGCAQTGTGKTAAFLLPILHHLQANPKPVEPGCPRALILAPTRELAAQIAVSVSTYGRYLGLPYAVVFGGVSQFPQVQALRRRAALVVATPGRLMDLMNQKHLSLEAIEEFVLDEADRMLDMGFLPDIRKILAQLPSPRHSQFFSATLSKEVLLLAKEMVTDPVQVTIEPDKPTVDKIHQVLMFVDKVRKDALLAHLFGTREDMSRVLVFARTRHGADKIVRKLESANIPADAIHSDKTQRARTEALDAFKRGRVRALVATDIASRGLDVEEVSHVINFDLPEEAESYIHRIGRTARAGASGCAISFVSAEERGLLRAIERMIKKSIAVEHIDEFHSERAEKAAGRKTTGEADPPPPAWAARKKAVANREERRESKFRERPPRGGNEGRRQSDFRRREVDEEQPPYRPAPERDGGSPSRPQRRPDRGPREERPWREAQPPRRERSSRPDGKPSHFEQRPERFERKPERFERKPERFERKPERFERKPERLERGGRDDARFERKRPPHRADAWAHEERRSDDERPPRKRPYDQRQAGASAPPSSDFKKGAFGKQPRFEQKRPRDWSEGRPPREERRSDDERPARSQDFRKGKPGGNPRFRDDRDESRKTSKAPHPFARFLKRKK